MELQLDGVDLRSQPLLHRPCPDRDVAHLERGGLETESGRGARQTLLQSEAHSIPGRDPEGKLLVIPGVGLDPGNHRGRAYHLDDDGVGLIGGRGDLLQGEGVAGDGPVEVRNRGCVEAERRPQAVRLL